MTLVLKNNKDTYTLNHLAKHLDKSALIGQLGTSMRLDFSTIIVEPSSFVAYDPFVKLVLPQYIKSAEMVTSVVNKNSCNDSLSDGSFGEHVLKSLDVEQGLPDEGLSDLNRDLVVDSNDESNNLDDYMDIDVVGRRRACNKVDLFFGGLFILFIGVYGYLNIFVDDR